MNHPKGKIIAIGGAEDKGTDLELGIIHRDNLNFFELGILRRIVSEAGGTDAGIEVITTASGTPKEVGNNYLNAFSKIGCPNVGIIPIRDQDQVRKKDYLKRIREADVVMFSGGNQYRLTTVFRDSEFLKILRDRYQSDDEFVIAGTSAGAMSLSSITIYDGNSGRAHLKGEVKMTAGLGFINNAIFDSHFDKRGRFARLVQAIALHPSYLGIGLGEDTGIIIKNGNEMEAIGSGMVIIIDGHHIRHSNIGEIPEGNPISVENLAVHFMTAGDLFRIQERKFEPKRLAERVEG